MAYLHGKFVWFEHISDSVDAARRFYGELLGWHIDPHAMGEQTYHMIMNGEEGIGGFRQTMPGMPNHWMGYLSVADVDAAAQAAAGAGAKVLMPPTDFGPVGRGATLADPQGAVFSIWRSADGDREDREPIAAGDWYWNELMTTDEQAALAFYESVFGFAHDSMDMGPQGTYYILTKDKIARAGLMRNPQQNVPPMWMPYIRVADCDASAERAKSLGGQICVPPTDIPEVGRFAVCLDPTSAAIGMIRGLR